MKWPWSKVRRDEEEHSEAKHAHARALEDKHKAEQKWGDVEDTLSIIRPNGFGRDVRTVMQRKRA